MDIQMTSSAYDLAVTGDWDSIEEITVGFLGHDHSLTFTVAEWEAFTAEVADLMAYSAS